MWKKRVSLRDVQDASPAESQEETRVMQSIERNDPAGTSSRQFDQVTAIPSELKSEDGTSLEEEQNVEDELLNCTASINKMHAQIDSSGPAPAEIFRDKKKKANTQADAFAANAGQLFHRFQKRRPKPEDVETGSRKSKKMKSKNPNLESLNDFRDLVVSNKDYTFTYIRNALLFLIIPSTGLACLLFYVFENPGVNDKSWWEVLELEKVQTAAPTTNAANTTAYTTAEENSAGDGIMDVIANQPWDASYSYWILLIGARQVITFGLARFSQFLVVSYTLRNPEFGMMGPLARLFLLQARGWPLQLISWAAIDLVMLYGNGDFATHWLFFQDYFEVFNASNPGGQVTSNARYKNILILAIAAGTAIAFKRFVIGLRFGKTSYHRYAEKLSSVLRQVLLVSKVAKSALFLGLDIDEVEKVKGLEGWLHAGESQVETEATEDAQGGGDFLQQPGLDEPGTKSLLSDSENVKIAELLGEWEETATGDTQVEDPSLSAIVQFRASIGVLDSDLPFSQAFGYAKNRAQVINGAQNLYVNLLKKQNATQNKDEDEAGSTLRFHTVALTALKKHGKFDDKVARDLVTLFRPSRDGDMGLIDFCKSIDTLYKEIRKLRASITTESRMNAASETCINVVFYFIIGMIVLAVLGMDPVALFGFMASFILGFSFMISGASSDYFRGLLFILLQRPYDIGDRIAVSSPQSDASGGGSSGWIVQDVTLYHTTVVYGTTQEYATFSNGALSGSRIINAARSPQATLNFVMKFGIKVSTKTIEKFKEEVIAFVRSKPREWLAFSAFRMTRIEADQGFVEYKCILQHREAWQQIGALLTSLAEVQSYAFELSKEMGMDYVCPSLPVEMRLPRAGPGQREDPRSADLDSVSTALNRMFG